MAMDPKLMKMLEEEYEALYMKTKNPCTSSREREVMFRLIEFGKKNLALVGYSVDPPKSRGAGRICPSRDEEFFAVSIYFR